MLFQTRHESPGDVVILTFRVHNHKIIIATELQMADGWQKEMGHIKNCNLTCISRLKRCIFRNNARFPGLYVITKS